MQYNISESTWWALQFPKEFNYNPPEDFESADMRIVFCFPSDPLTRILSSTQYVLYNIVKAIYGDCVFVDFAMLNLSQARVTQKKAGVPPWYGLISKRSLSEFDMVGMSIAITSSEFAGAYQALRDSGISLFPEERRDDKNSPVVFAGGVAIDNSAALDDVLDFKVWGLGERAIPEILEEAYNVMRTFGDIRTHKGQLFEHIKNKPGIVFPSAYPFESRVVNGVVKHFASETLPGYPERVYPDMNLSIDAYGSSSDVQYKLSLNRGQRKAQVAMSWGCSGFGCCSFCHEGNLYGAWREREKEDLFTGIWRAKQTSMCDSLTFQSFNSNFYSDLPAIAAEALRVFDKLSVLNFRADTVAYNPDILELLKISGAIVISFAVEGFGSRIRNGFLNKNLFRPELVTAAKAVFDKRFSKLKLGYIWTGQETGNDFKEALDELDEIIAYRDSIQVNTRLWANVTPLVHLPFTPMYAQPRVMAYYSWLEVFDKTFYHNPFFDFVDRGIKTKLTTKKGDVFLQQLFVDLGKLAKPILLDTVPKNGAISGASYWEAIREKMVEYGIDAQSQFLEKERGENWFSRMSVGKREEMWDELAGGHAYCLQTEASIGRGAISTCYQCGQCESFEKEGFYPEITNRSLNLSFDMTPVITAKLKNAPAHFYLFLGEVTEKGRYVSKSALWRSFFQKAATEGNLVVENFRSLISGFYQRLDHEYFPSHYAGQDCVIAGFRDPIDTVDILRTNKHVEGLQLINAFPTESRSTDFELVYRISGGDAEIYMKAIEEVRKRGTVRIPGSSHAAPEEVPFSGQVSIMDNFMYIATTSKVSPFYLFTRLFTFSKAYSMFKVDIQNILMEKSQNSLVNTSFFSGNSVYKYVGMI